jgi:hypothetical protein
MYKLVAGTPTPQPAGELIVETKLNAMRFKLPGQSVVTIIAIHKTANIAQMFTSGSCRDW